jgi:hypothetical protein
VQAEVALAFTGEQGSGKGVVWRYFGNMFAPHFRHFNDPDQFTGKFNADLGQAVFVFLDEAIWGGNKKNAGMIKAMITEPTLQIEKKGIDRMEAPNRLSIVAASNADWAVPVETGDRRWGVFRTNNRYAFKENDPTSEAYFNALHEQMEHGGLAAMLYDLLLCWKVSANDIRNVPNTEEKARLKSLALAPTEMWLEEILQLAEIPPNDAFGRTPWSEDGLVIIDRELPYTGYKEFCKDHGKRPDRKNIWERTLDKILGKAVAPEYRERINGKPGARKFKFGPLDQCRRLFDHHVGNEPGGEHWAPPPPAASEETWRKFKVPLPEVELEDCPAGT